MRFANPSKKTKVHASAKGHAIEFPGRVVLDAKGKPPAGFVLPVGAVLSKDGLIFVHVVPQLHAEIAGAGFEPESEMGEPAEPELPKRPEDPLKFQEDLYAAFDAVVEGARRDDFAGSGMPKSEPIEKLTGYPVTSAEIKDAWPKYLASKKD